MIDILPLPPLSFRAALAITIAVCSATLTIATVSIFTFKTV